MPCGAGVAAGPFHSQTNEAWFTKTPGLKVVYPAFPYDVKGLLNTAINDPNPVMFFEHKQLYRSVYQDVPVDYYTIPFGKASLIKEGKNEEEIEAFNKKYPKSEHPVIRTHPNTGQKTIYVNIAFTQEIKGWSNSESDKMLKYLYQPSRVWFKSLALKGTQNSNLSYVKS